MRATQEANKVLMQTVFPYVSENGDDDSFIFQQDGAPVHYVKVVRNALKAWFRDRSSH